MEFYKLKHIEEINSFKVIELFLLKNVADKDFTYLTLFFVCMKFDDTFNLSTSYF